MRKRRRDGTRAAPIVILIAGLPLSSCGLFAKVLGVSTDCERYAQELDFATSDRILRGAWEGTVSDLAAPADTRTLRLDLTASTLTSSRYEIQGTFALEGESPASIHGTVSGGCAERYLGVAAMAEDPSADPDLSTQSIPPSASLAAETRDAAGTTQWRVTASGPPVAGGLVQEDSLVLEIESVADDTVDGPATLERVGAP